MKKEKGFAISIILYSLVFLIITALFIILGILKTRYGVSNKIRKSVIESVDAGDYAFVVFKRDLTRSKRALPIWIDTMDTPYDIRDNVYYVATPKNFSNSTDTTTLVDNNYVWYSGKLWRIVAMYPDKTLKLVTDRVIATINYGNPDFDKSYIYQWLNEDFLDTLYNSDEIVEDTTWNFTVDDGEVPSRPETLPNQQTVTAKVGLLNAYEVYHTGYMPETPGYFYDVRYTRNLLTIRSYPKVEGSYLYRNNKEGAWWLLNRHHSSYIWTIDTLYSGLTGFSNKVAGVDGLSYGMRPSIKLKYNVRFRGSGTKDDPYTIVDDVGKPVYNETRLNTRVSGEYVNFNGERYRIVELDNNNTRIILDGVSDYSNMGKISSSNYWGKSDNLAYERGRENHPSYMYADYYFNNIWYDAIPTNYKNMIVDGNFYIGKYGTGYTSYKSTVCKNILANPSATAPTIKECAKWENDETRVFVGKVGLPRVGQMFSSSIITTGSSSHIVMMSNTTLIYVGTYDGASNISLYRPCITLSSSVKITGGNGTQDSPFEISL